MRSYLPALILTGLLAFSALSACGSLRTPCEQMCYGQKTNEPRDFDDCIRRCKK